MGTMSVDVSVSSSILQRVQAKHRCQRTLDNQVRSQDSHPANTDTSLSSSIGGTEACEDNG